MELKWLEDFIALAKYRSFSKAAQTRFVTQPAFSRRIRALEQWLGLQLVNRDTHPITFSAAGLEFLACAETLAENIYAVRDQLRASARGDHSIEILTQHSLMIAFVPSLMQRCTTLFQHTLIKWQSHDQQDSLTEFFNASHRLLLCFSALDLPYRVRSKEVEFLTLGQDQLLPVCEPRYRVPAEGVLRLINYPRHSFFARLIKKACLDNLAERFDVQTVFESQIAAGLKPMVQQGYGVAWLPKSLIIHELERGDLCQIEQAPFIPIELSINLYRFRAFHSDTHDHIWQSLKQTFASEAVALESEALLLPR